MISSDTLIDLAYCTMIEKLNNVSKMADLRLLNNFLFLLLFILFYFYFLNFTTGTNKVFSIELNVLI